MAIPRRAESGPAPLSFAQSRWWFLNQLEPETTALHNWARVTRWRGALDRQVLERSLAEMVRRHEVLRTRFSFLNGTVVQEVMPPGEFQLHWLDLSTTPSEDRLHEARRCTAQELHRPFDLYRGPLFRALLLKLNPDEHMLVVALHHSISDGWSMQVFFRELTTLYSAFIAGEPSPLAELPIQYGDYAAWQREQFQGDVLQRELGYWRERLEGRPAVLDLPTDRQRPRAQTYRGGQVSFTLPQPLVEALTALARRERASLFMVLLAGFKALLWRYSGQTDLLVGVPIAGRNQMEVEGLIGCFVNALILRTDLAGDPSLRELVARVRAAALGAYAHHELPFEKVVEELQPERSASYHPIFQIMFNFRDFPPTAQEIPGVRLEDVKLERSTALFDLSLALVRGAEGITCGLGYSADLFDLETVERLSRQYRALLEGAVAEPDCPLSAVSLWTDRERRQVLRDWNDTARDYQPEACVHQLFERQARHAPSRVALLFKEQRVTYGELNHRANQLAHHLISVGVGPETRVGLCLDRSVEMVVALVAVLKAGAAYVPLDPSYPKERLAYMLDDANVSALVVDQAHNRPSNGGVPVVAIDLNGWSFATEPGQDPVTGVGPDNLAYVMYTSGSTGRPKGVMVSHRSIVNHLRWRDEYFPLTPADRGLQKASLGFDDSVWEIFEPLLAGAQLVLVPPEARADSTEIVRLIADNSVTTACFVPSMLQVVLDEPELQNCTSLRRVTTGGETLSVELQDRFFSQLRSSLHNGYGPTEATIGATFWTCKADRKRHRVPIGRPIANTTIYVLDRMLQPVPIGVPGEVCIGGMGLARGYHRRPGLTAERFVPDPFGEVSGARLYRTGDRARYLPDGTLEFFGRLDSQIKLRGNRIELGEIEAVLREHPAVQESVVLAREDRSGEHRLVGYVVPRQGEPSPSGWGGVERLRQEHLSQWQARYEEIYSQGASAIPLDFDITGWISSYTDRPIPPAEMHEWVDRTVERILDLQPRRVLEIGCGTGLLLLHVAPHCQTYIGTDFSPTVLQSLQERVNLAELSSRVTLLQRESSDFGGLASGSVDLVVINSVAQYLPGIEHLLRVIGGALDVLAPGGSIFIGDVRNFDLLEAFHASVELFRAAGSMTTAELRRRVSERMAAESELAISPGFFAALPNHLPAIARVEVLLKRGRADNELTRFRYDATLRLQSAEPRDPAPAVKVIDWATSGLEMAQLRSLLLTGEPAVYLKQVPNSRVEADTFAVELLERPELETVAELRQMLRSGGARGHSPEDFWVVGTGLGYSVEVTWSTQSSDGHYDVLLWRQNSVRPLLAHTQRSASLDQRAWARYANQPSANSLSHSLVAELRHHLSQRLPDHMIPQAFVLLDALPLTPSGKIDRHSLPEPESGRTVQESYQAPVTPAERTIAEIWTSVLKVSRVGIRDNFFELGGHSLLATQAMSRIRRAFGIDLPLRTIFEAPTVTALAAAITDQPSNGNTASAERLLRDLDEISDEEAERLLAAEGRSERL